MPQPVKISDKLLSDARQVNALMHRSIAGQVEHWAMLGRAVEALLRTSEIVALQKRGEVQPLGKILASVDTVPGRKRLKAYLRSLPYPHFEQHPEQRDLLIRIDEDGRRTVGRMVDRRFTPVDVVASGH